MNAHASTHPALARDVWETRFDREGRIWGEQASPPARYLTRKLLDHRSSILEIGAGYGRDANWFVENGHTVTAIDKATNALTIATDDLRNKIHSENISFIISDFRRASLGTKSHDVFFSHRVLHLLGTNGVTEAFANTAAKVLKPEGVLLVTARSFKDFNPEQMSWIDKTNGVAEYRTDIKELENRKGQTLSFWDADKLRKLFSNDFDHISIVEDTEPESVTNLKKDGTPILTHYVSISARRKYSSPNY